MSNSRAKRDSGADGSSRPEDPNTQRLKRSKRLLRSDMLPDGAATVTQAEDERDSETEAVLKRATDDREQEEPA
jgi:hypothetical protein